MGEARGTAETILRCHKNLVTGCFQLETQRMSQNGGPTLVFFNSVKLDS